MSRPSVEAVVALSPGEAITRVVFGVSLERNRGVPVAPRVTAEGTRVPLPSRLLAGSGEVIVTVRDEATVVRIDGAPPPWPFSMSWERRTLRRLLGKQVLRFRSSPSSGG